MLLRLLCLGCSDVVIVGFDCIYPCIDGYRCMFIWSECLHLLSYDFFRKSGLQISIDDQCPVMVFWHIYGFWPQDTELPDVECVMELFQI